jgi:hypothetical protein
MNWQWLEPRVSPGWGSQEAAIRVVAKVVNMYYVVIFDFAIVALLFSCSVLLIWFWTELIRRREPQPAYRKALAREQSRVPMKEEAGALPKPVGRWKQRKERAMRETILLIENPNTGNPSALAGLKAAGYRVITAGPTHALAFLFILRCVNGVLIDGGLGEARAIEVAQSLRKLCRQTPIILLSPVPSVNLPPPIDTYINSRLPGPELTISVIEALSLLRAQRQRDSMAIA